MRCPGGNDPTLVDIYDSGWRDLTLFDYCGDAVERTKALFGDRAVRALQADARDLPLETDAFDAILDKGTLDVLFMTDRRTFDDSISELSRVAKPGAVLVSLSRVVPTEDMLDAFDERDWERLRDGDRYFTAAGECTSDLAADLYAWERR